MKVICVSGTPGTGKTTVAKKLARRLKFYYFDVNSFISKKKLSDGYDKKRKSKIIDTKKLSKAIVGELALIRKRKKHAGAIIDSHLSHHLPPRVVDLCIITKCDLRTLSKRLRKRKYPQKKIDENLQAEIFDMCYEEAKIAKHKIMVVDTSKHFNMSKISKFIGK